MKRVFRHYVTCRFGQQCADVQTSPLVGLKAPIPVFFLFFYSPTYDGCENARVP